MPHRALIRLAWRLVLVLLGVLPGIPPAATAASTDPPAAIYFPTTGQTLRGDFLRAWIEQGMLALGPPLTPTLAEEGRLVQYFEYARLEHSRALGAPIGLGLVGREAVTDWSRAGFAPLSPGAPDPARRAFVETGHTLAYAFRRFWETRGGLARFGLPLSEELTEDGQTVQYFERARFVYTPERAATGPDVTLSPLGRQAAYRHGYILTPTERPAEAVTWGPALQFELTAWLKARQQTAAQARLTTIAPLQIAVSAGEAPTYWAPSPAALDAGPVYARSLYLVDGVVTGEPVAGDDRWYRLTLDGSFIPAAFIRPFTPPPPPRTWSGRWVDVNLASFILTVYDGEQPLRSALITAGRKNRTPTGVFFIQRRVRSETMDSSTVGFPPGHPEYYRLTNVEYTQYFTSLGHALHGNYWVHPSRFGEFSSNGCLGLRTHDAAWVWELTTIGTPVFIHDQ